MTLIEDCQDCDWSETWQGGRVSGDPSLEHVLDNPSHTVKTTNADSGDELD